VRPTYVYDVRSQYERPVFIVYDDAHVEPCIMALYGEYPEFLHVTKIRMHKSGPHERYLDIPEGKRK
jgi:hypothetical protein